MSRVEFKVKIEDMHSRFAKEAELTTFRMLLYQRPNVLLG
jgi:hypothetical protein